MKVKVDSQKCTGHGLCYEFAPNVFRSDEEGRSVVIGDGTVAPEHEDEAYQAIQACPEQAISAD